MRGAVTSTLYWRAIKRVERRSRALRDDPSPARAALLAEAARTANRLYWIAYGWR